MEIIVCSISGYCHGVEKTLQNADSCLMQACKKSIPSYSVGTLIHNEYVVSQYCEKGLKVIEKPSDAEPGIALIRAHGIPDSLRSQFIDAGFELIDSTCINIKKSVSAMKKAFEDGRRIIVIGLHSHSETETLLGVEVDGKKIADFELNEPKQIGQLKRTLSSDSKISVIVQTTFDQDKYNSIISELRKFYTDIREEKTFCNECLKRKELALQLAQVCDAMIVVGSSKSANSKELARWVEKRGTKVFFISSAEQLDEQTVSKMKQYGKIGICSGTSTPSQLIKGIVKALGSST